MTSEISGFFLFFFSKWKFTGNCRLRLWLVRSDGYGAINIFRVPVTSNWISMNMSNAVEGQRCSIELIWILWSTGSIFSLSLVYTITSYHLYDSITLLHIMIRILAGNVYLTGTMTFEPKYLSLLVLSVLAANVWCISIASSATSHKLMVILLDGFRWDYVQKVDDFLFLFIVYDGKLCS